MVGHEEQYVLDQKIFQNLKCLILINTGLTWKGLFKVLWAFKDIEELILCKNDLSDIENVQEDKVNLLQ